MVPQQIARLYVSALPTEVDVVMFIRVVKSRSFFERMKGRDVRTSYALGVAA